MRRNFDMTETRLLVAAAQAGDELAAIQLLAGRERAAGGWLPQMRIRPARANGRLALVAHGVLVLELESGRVAGFDAFIDPKVFERAGAV